jgi:UDP-N-acetylglucosamine--N-acetylmuramyl-(pentapeptide) pyrophosphoryl-undecaprenol N-acetylglucosamine transferase
MKILLTGGGTGGHFYPIIAVAEELNKIIEEEKIVSAELIFMSTEPYDKELLADKQIRFKKAPAGKMRRYFSLYNIIDHIKTFIGVLKTLWSVYIDFPDVIFSKGGYASFPALFAAKFFRIPIIIHESDVVPGRVTMWASSFAKRIAVSFPETLTYFPEEIQKRTAVIGNPVRKELLTPSKEGAKEFLKLEEQVPVLLILGGSQGAQKINDTVLNILPELLEKYQIIHQCGKKNIKEVEGRAAIVLEKSKLRHRYHPFGFLNEVSMRMAAGAADLVISRAGGAAIFEIAGWGKPSVLIPLQNSAQDHQRKNAYAFARITGADVIEEKNLTPHILIAEIDRLFADPEKMKSVGEKSREFSKPDAARKIAREIINLALEHA